MSAGIVSKWDHGSYEESVIQDDFVANMHDGEIKRKLLKETRTPQKALELAINVEWVRQTNLIFRELLHTQY